MRIIIIGAGLVGSTVTEALHDEHDVTVVDLDGTRLAPLAGRYDVTTLEGNGASRRLLEQAGARRAHLVIACTPRDEVNIVAAMLAKKLAPQVKAVVRTTNVEYLEVWHERQLDVDFIVSSELETAYAVSRLIGVPAARQTDVFADGQVQIVEFDVDPALPAGDLVGRPLRAAGIPPSSKVASIIRAGEVLFPSGDERIEGGDRIVVIGSPDAARAWSAALGRSSEQVEDVVVFGCGPVGAAVAQALLRQGIRVRVVERSADRAREAASELVDARVFHAAQLDEDFLERERIGQADAGIFALHDDAASLYAAALAKLHGLRLAIAIVQESVSERLFEQAGIDITVNPRLLAAEEIVRFAHDPRTRQVAMLQGNRFEVLDITVRAESSLTGTPFRDLPITGSLIGAIVRNGHVLFPHGDDVLLPHDRAIIFTESSRVSQVERAL